MKKNVLTVMLIVSGFLSFASAQVGINNSSPQGTFHVDGAKDNPAIGVPSAAQQANDMVVTNIGDVGVGITAPANKFHVVTTSANLNRFTLIDAPASTNQHAIMALRNTSPLATGNFSLLGFSNSGPTSGGAAWGIGSVRTSTAEDFFMGNSLGGGYLERLRITSTGNVGIGTSTPTETLDVAGTLRVRTVTTSTIPEDKLLVVGATGEVRKSDIAHSEIPRKVIFNTPTIAPGDSYTVDTTGYDLTYAMLNVTTGNACGRPMIASFFKATSILSNLGAQARDVIGTWSVLDAFGNSGRMVFPNVLGCADGGGGTQFDFDIMISSGSDNITITNRGNIAKAYTIRALTKL